MFNFSYLRALVQLRYKKDTVYVSVLDPCKTAQHRNNSPLESHQSIALPILHSL